MVDPFIDVFPHQTVRFTESPGQILSDDVQTPAVRLSAGA